MFNCLLLSLPFNASRFQSDLERLFPDRLPLMHVGRYLLHPANYLWEEITRAFRAYLAPHQHRVGIQAPPSNASLPSQVLGEQELLQGQGQQQGEKNEIENGEHVKADDAVKKTGEKGDEKKLEETKMLGSKDGNGEEAEVERLAGGEGRRKGGSVGVFVASLRAVYGKKRGTTTGTGTSSRTRGS
ncbi:unnamed protein product [Closterium sp. NIES-54]